MAQLGVNIDHVATLREVRHASYPDPVTAATLVELAGAHQVTVHLREDRRHIQDRDVRLLREVISTRLNLEMAVTSEMLKIALQMKPDSVTFVPERREELTTEGGLEVQLQRETMLKAVSVLKEAGIRAYLFIDPDLDQVKASHLVHADGVEFHTGKYCQAHDLGNQGIQDKNEEIARLENAVRMAEKLNLRIAAGHGLHYQNIGPLTQWKAIEEYNIGHSIIARSIFVGLTEAVREMLRLIG